MSTVTRNSSASDTSVCGDGEEGCGRMEAGEAGGCVAGIGGVGADGEDKEVGGGGRSGEGAPEVLLLLLDSASLLLRQRVIRARGHIVVIVVIIRLRDLTRGVATASDCGGRGDTTVDVNFSFARSTDADTGCRTIR